MEELLLIQSESVVDSPDQFAPPALNLTIGGVRAYNLDNLNGKKTEDKFKVFIGFKNRVCCNLCVWTDGFKAELRARSVSEIVQEYFTLFSSFQP